MIEVSKIKYQDIPVQIYNEFVRDSHFEYYKITQSHYVLGYFIAYENHFHNGNKYILPTNHTFSVLKSEEIFKTIRNYFHKPIQVMVDSNKKKIIKVLENTGFILKRRSFEREFQFSDIKFLSNNTINLKVYAKGALIYNVACSMAYQYYTETHRDVNPITGTLEQFKAILPDKIICHIENEKIISFCYVENNELCYFYTKDQATFDMFSQSVLQYIFRLYKSILIEVDSTDLIALRFKLNFNDINNDSHDTYIYY